jgi:hypothetical protein
MPAPEVIEKMVGTRRLELLTSTVSTPLPTGIASIYAASTAPSGGFKERGEMLIVP